MLTSNYMTTFEFAKLVGLRVVHIVDENLDTEEGATPEQQAVREIAEGRNPSVIRRYLPDGTHEDRSASSLKLSFNILRRISELQGGQGWKESPTRPSALH